MKIALKATVFFLSLLLIGIRTAPARTGYPLAGPTKPIGASFQAVVLPTATANVINVFVEKVVGRSVAVRVLSQSGIELSCQYMQKRIDKGHIRFNLEALTDGLYKIEVSDGQSKSVYPFTLSTNEPVVVKRAISLL